MELAVQKISLVDISLELKPALASLLALYEISFVDD